MIEIYTDGGYLPEDKIIGYGFIYRYHAHLLQGSGAHKCLHDHDNQNTAELIAILNALKTLTERNYKTILYTDSSYCVDIYNNIINDIKFKSKQTNIDLVCALKPLIFSYKDLRFVKVDAHSGFKLNTQVDHIVSDEMHKLKRELELNNQIDF